jgi:TRAP transporter 4TM/12TM fusion protein
LTTDHDGAVERIKDPLAARLLLAAIIGLGVLWILGVPRLFGIAIIMEEYLGVVTGLVTAAGLLVYPSPRTGGPGILNYVLALLGLASWAWMAVNYSDWLLDMANRGPDKWLPAVIGILLVLEATRRACGNAIAILVGVIGLYALFGHFLPGVAEASYTAPTRLALYLFADSSAVPGTVLAVAASVIIAFILFGATLHATGGAATFTDLALATMGHYRGGPAKVSIAASSIFGTLSGSTVGNVMSTGVVTIPLMKRFRFPPHYAAAVEAVASNGGQLAPPVMGATAFLIAEFLQVGYASVVMAAIVPAFIYYMVLFLQVDAYAARHEIVGLDRDSLPKLAEVLRKSLPLLVPLGLLVYLLFWKSWPAGRAALAAVGACLILDMITQRKIRPFSFWADFVVTGGRTILPVLLVCAAAGIVIGSLNISGIGFTLTMQLTHVGETYGILPLLIVCAIAAIILGMGMPTAAVYVLLSVLLAPALVRAGIEPIAAHFFIFYFGLLSMITPPVAVASYAAASIAGSDLWRTGLSGVKLAAAAYLLPFVFALNPALLLVGQWNEILYAILAMLVAGYLLSLAFVEPRYLWRGVALTAAVGTGAATAALPADSLAIPAVALGGFALGCLQQRTTPNPVPAVDRPIVRKEAS